VDIEVENATGILIEVVTPEMWHELRHSSKALFVKNRVPRMLISETQKHLRSFPDELSAPFLIAVDRSQTEISAYDVQNALWGTRAVSLVPDAPDPKESVRYLRYDDAITRRDSKSLLVSGVLLFKKDFTLCGKPIYEINWVLNPKARNPLNQRDCRMISDCFPR